MIYAAEKWRKDFGVDEIVKSVFILVQEYHDRMLIIHGIQGLPVSGKGGGEQVLSSILPQDRQGAPLWDM
jgi:hypothetical protein